MSYAVVTTVISAAAKYDLTDLATVKTELNLSSFTNDAWLAQAITQVSKTIARHCKRSFVPEQVQDVFDVQQDPYPYQTPGGFAQLQLTRWPVLAVRSVVQSVALNTTQALSEGIDFRTDPATGCLLRLNPFTGAVSTWEAVPVTVIYTAGYGALVMEAGTVPAAAPYAVTVSQAASFSCDQAVSYANGASLTPVTSLPMKGQYSVAAGVYTFAAADTGSALTFSYATASVPEDLVEIALRLITVRFKAKDRDPTLIQQDTPGIGTQRWWFGGAPGQKGPFPPDITATLDDYRTPTVA